MAYERFANGGLSSLAAGIDSSVTSLTVKSAVGFPTGGNFRIVVDSEIMLVTDVQGNVFTVARAQEGASAASHNADAAVFHVLTAGSLAQRDIEQFATGAITTRDAAGQAGRLYLPTEGLVGYDNGTSWDMMPLNKMTPPVSGDFSWVNQGTSTVATTKGMMVLAPQSSASDSLRLLVKNAPATPYTITVAMLPLSGKYITSYSIPQFGICWRDSATSKILTYGWGVSSYSLGFLYAQWTNHTTLSGGQYQYGGVPQVPFWIRFSDDGTYRNVQVSSDGVTFANITAPQSRTTFLTADQVGVFVNSWKTSGLLPRVVSFLNWSEA